MHEGTQVDILSHCFGFAGLGYSLVYPGGLGSAKDMGRVILVQAWDSRGYMDWLHPMPAHSYLLVLVRPLARLAYQPFS